MARKFGHEINQFGLGRISASRIESPEISVRVMSWNIHKGVGGLDRRYNLDRTIAVLKRYDPDILLLQEVAQDIRSLRRHNQVELLAQALELYPTFYPEHKFQVGTYGNMIRARWPISDSIHLDLTIGSRQKRGLLQGHVRIDVKGHQHTLIVHNIHFGLASSERDPQLDRFVSSEPFRKLHRSTPIIVGGDLNDLWGSLGSTEMVIVRARCESRAYQYQPLIEDGRLE